MNIEQLKPSEQLCIVMSRIYDSKLTTVSGGNLSVKDKEGNIWVTPSGGDKGNYLQEDILKILPNGEIIGNKKPSIETGIHQSILTDRQELIAVVHAHPPALVAISLLHQLPEVMMLPWVANQVRGIMLSEYDCPGSEELRENVIKEFKKGSNTVILANHGAFIASEKGLSYAFENFQNLDISVRIQAKATLLTGKSPNLILKEQLEYYNTAEDPRLDSFVVENITKKEKEIKKAICDLAKRAYKRDFFTRTVGVISARIEKDSFVITGDGVDNADLSDEDLVFVKGMSVEKGKKPAKSVLLHKKIYDENPEINSIIMAAPLNAMVFGVTDVEYDVKTIPECYIVLREIVKFPFGATKNKQNDIAKHLGKKAPVAIVKNECFICTGASVFKAFDRLEVAEFSAEAVINAKMLGGEIKSITEKQINELNENFRLI